MQNFDQTPFNQLQSRIGNTNVKICIDMCNSIIFLFLFEAKQEETAKLEHSRENISQQQHH